MSKENTYNWRGISNHYPKPEPDPNDPKLIIRRLRKGRVQDVRLAKEASAHENPVMDSMNIYE